ncbi:hypothetical protein [Bacillus velezensis]|uniref:hypothetical protein n=1 Tax=Bacillus velezensis TaxID=492670 RepID=UPI00211CF7EB|nr:hypothetical protein [Bacillus velezensis]
MYRVGETVRYWGTRSEGLTWLSAEAMTGKIIGRQHEERIYKIEGQSVGNRSRCSGKVN